MGSSAAAPPLGIVWARDKGEWWPASLLKIDHEQRYHVAFLGFGKRHNLALPAVEIRFEEPKRQHFQPPHAPHEAERAGSPHNVMTSGKSGRWRAQPKSSSPSSTPSKRRRDPKNEKKAPSTPTRKLALLSSGTPPAKHARCKWRQHDSQASRDELDTAAMRACSPLARAEPRFRLKIRVPSELECEGCTGVGTGNEMICCTGECGGWCHPRCAGVADAPATRTFICPRCEPPPAWSPRRHVKMKAEGRGRGQREAKAAELALGGEQSERAQVRSLLQALYDDRLMEADLRKQLRRFGLAATLGASSLPGELRARLIDFIQEWLRAEEDRMEADEASAATCEAPTEGEREEIGDGETMVLDEKGDEGERADEGWEEDEGMKADEGGRAEEGARKEERASAVDEERAEGGMREHDAEGEDAGVGEDEGDERSACSGVCTVCLMDLPPQGSSSVVSCEVCECLTHLHCLGLRRPREPSWCIQCKAVGGSVALAFARSLGCAPPDVMKHAHALRHAAARVPAAARAALAEQAASSAERSRERALGMGAPLQVARAQAFDAARATARRLEAALFVKGCEHEEAELCVCRLALEGGAGELFYAVVGHVGETTTLRAIACVCRAWSVLLDRSASEEAACAWRGAWLIAPRGRLTLAAAVRSTRPGDRLRITAGVHTGQVILPHALQVEGEAGAVLSGPITLCDSSGSRCGALRGLRIEHFYETAVTISSGRWTINGCEIASSRAPNRACVAIVLRNVSSIQVDSCWIGDCSAAVQLSSARAMLQARSSSFGNARCAIEAIRGGHIDVQRCTFDVGSCDVGMRIAPDTEGVVQANRVRGAGSLWGRTVPSAVVKYSDELDADDVL